MNKIVKVSIISILSIICFNLNALQRGSVESTACFHKCLSETLPAHKVVSGEVLRNATSKCHNRCLSI